MDCDSHLSKLRRMHHSPLLPLRTAEGRCLMSNILTDLKAALEAVDVARKTLALPLPISEVAYLEREEALYSALGTYHKLATDDTIRALLDVAEAAERESDCPLCGAETHTAGRRAVPEPHLPDCPLAPLVKEADDE